VPTVSLEDKKRRVKQKKRNSVAVGESIDHRVPVEKAEEPVERAGSPQMEEFTFEMTKGEAQLGEDSSLKNLHS
jgi:hypothetical protein